MIQFEDVSFSYGSLKVLSRVSLQVGPRETLVVLGGSGSGKSTLLRLLLGLIEPDEGHIFINGEDITLASSARLVELRQKMGMVFQEGALFDSLTVGENVGYFFIEHGMRGRKHKAGLEGLVREMLAMVGLEQTIDQMPSSLSGGMRRRVAVARSLIYQPEIMLYDEPTTGLDPATCENLCQLINDVKRLRQVAGIMVTHNLDDAWAVGDRFLLLREGRALWQGSASELKAMPAEALPRFFRGQDNPGMSAGGKTSSVRP
jgi:phospholipid/cholesterol/gamma-HCH transport system ATP-binding protein